jgi:hypothetical protein
VTAQSCASRPHIAPVENPGFAHGGGHWAGSLVGRRVQRCRGIGPRRLGRGGAVVAVRRGARRNADAAPDRREGHGGGTEFDQPDRVPPQLTRQRVARVDRFGERHRPQPAASNRPAGARRPPSRAVSDVSSTTVSDELEQWLGGDQPKTLAAHPLVRAIFASARQPAIRAPRHRSVFGALVFGLTLPIARIVATPIAPSSAPSSASTRSRRSTPRPMITTPSDGRVSRPEEGGARNALSPRRWTGPALALIPAAPQVTPGPAPMRSWPGRGPAPGATGSRAC